MPNCTVTVVNDSSPIAIRAVRVNFQLADGTTRTKSKTGLNVTQGSSVAVESGPANCVKGTSTTVTVGQTQLAPKVSPTGNPCIVRVKWGLVDMGAHTFAAAGKEATATDATAGLQLKELDSAESD